MKIKLFLGKFRKIKKKKVFVIDYRLANTFEKCFHVADPFNRPAR